MLPIMLTLLGCWSNYWWKDYDEMNPLDPSRVPYQVDGLEATDALVTSFDAGMDCPDGSAATFFAVYRQQQSGPSPVALVFHSGAFDYVLDPDEDQPLAGEHYYLDSRLTRSWAVSKIWETLGMLYPRTLDDSELNLGALPAALTDAGVVQLYPGNCWGDLWHNEPGVVDNDGAEGFSRAGRQMALNMIEIMLDASAAQKVGFNLPVTLDTSQILLIGLGDGGRAVTEVLLSGEAPPVAGVLLDHSPDYLDAYTEQADVFAEEIEGLTRIFGETQVQDLSAFSLAAIDPEDRPDRLAYLWSSQDPRIPADAAGVSAAVLEADGTGWVHDTGARAHVATNGDLSTATAVVDYLLTGQTPALED